MNSLIGRKIGMTRIFTKEGISIPVTIIEIEPNRITKITNFLNKKYKTIQVTTGHKNQNKLNKSEIGLFKKIGLKIGRGLWEYKVPFNKEIKIGQELTLSIFNNIKKVDVTGFSKGKGFTGTVKRWNFRTQDATHGNSLSHRAPGSIGQNQTPGRVFKGKKMAGQLGNEQVTIQNLNIMRIDKQHNLLFVKGSVPGANSKTLIIKSAVKLVISRI